uniref:hypothetical protein n=1 Tax=uncultured Draconibacterium sp. TaxID=1573823 RepID=UPI003216618E
MTTNSRFSIRLILPVALLLFANYVLHSFIHYGAEFHLNKLVSFDNEFQIGLFKTIFIGMPLLGFILGLLFSFIPFKKLSYWKKYLSSALLSLLLLLSIYFILGGAGQLIK